MPWLLFFPLYLFCVGPQPSYQVSFQLNIQTLLKMSHPTRYKEVMYTQDFKLVHLEQLGQLRLLPNGNFGISLPRRAVWKQSVGCLLCLYAILSRYVMGTESCNLWNYRKNRFLFVEFLFDFSMFRCLQGFWLPCVSFTSLTYLGVWGSVILHNL